MLLQIFLIMYIFLIRIMTNIKKLITRAFIFSKLENGGISLPPLTLHLLESKPVVNGARRLDALIESRGNAPAMIFAAQIKTLSTPKVFIEGVALLKTTLLIMPFLNEKQLLELEREQISGADLCGNGVIIVPGKITVFRSGQPNQFPSYAPIKNIYRKKSSLAARIFLALSRFSSVKQVVEEIACRNIFSTFSRETPLTFATVSKVLAGLEDDLILLRGKNDISLLQPDTLLEKLLRHNNGASGSTIASVKIDLDQKTLYRRLAALSAELKTPVVATGISSVSRYAVMQREDILSVYCPRATELLERLAPTTASRFPNLEIIDTQDATVFFDARQDEGFYWASPVQTYLELMSGDKRDQETADQVKAFILSHLVGAR